MRLVLLNGVWSSADHRMEGMAKRGYLRGEKLKQGKNQQCCVLIE